MNPRTPLTATATSAGNGKASREAPEGLYPWDDRTTNGGYLAFLIGLSFFLSAIPGARPQIAGLSVHPYLLLLVASLPWALTPRNRTALHRGLGGAGVLLLIGLLIATFGSEHLRAGLQIYIKWITVALTFFVLERLISTVKDFRLAAYGVIAGVTLIALRGLYLYRLEPTYYLELLPGVGSRNVFSLWTITPMVFALLIFSSATAGRKAKLLMILSVIMLMVPQVLTLSRSGWLLIAAIFFLVFATRFRLRMLVPMVLAVFVLQLAITQLGFEEKVESRLQDLRTGTASDSLRKEIVFEGLELFVRNPLVGVSQADLPYEIGKVLYHPPTSSHNLIVDLLAGTGLIGALPFALCVFILARRWRGTLHRGHFSGEVDLRRALPILVLALGVRSLTSDEILFCPAIMFGLGAAYGLITSRPVPQTASPRPRVPELRRQPAGLVSSQPEAGSG
ncbi:MAG: O-antigen ligase family protein [Acidobacteriota bacterium]|nr:O-antigen ligase family protein [Acidobacteriota bacterium]